MKWAKIKVNKVIHSQYFFLFEENSINSLIDQRKEIFFYVTYTHFFILATGDWQDFLPSLVKL